MKIFAILGLFLVVSGFANMAFSEKSQDLTIYVTVVEKGSGG